MRLNDASANRAMWVLAALSTGAVLYHGWLTRTGRIRAPNWRETPTEFVQRTIEADTALRPLPLSRSLTTTRSAPSSSSSSPLSPAPTAVGDRSN
jgi:hypothetical protein